MFLVFCLNFLSRFTIFSAYKNPILAYLILDLFKIYSLHILLIVYHFSCVPFIHSSNIKLFINLYASYVYQLETDLWTILWFCCYRVCVFILEESTIWCIILANVLLSYTTTQHTQHNYSVSRYLKVYMRLLWTTSC